MLNILNENEIDTILESIKAGNDEFIPESVDKNIEGGPISRLLKALHSEAFPVYVKVGETRIRGGELSMLQPGDIIIVNDEELNDINTASVSGRAVSLENNGKTKPVASIRVDKNRILKNLTTVDNKKSGKISGIYED